ncbi:MAG: penicillin acylase family protein [Beutenbergiaceae bacterium]
MSTKSWWRRIAVGAAAFLVVVLLVSAATIFTISRRALPDHAGEFQVEGLDGEVEVLRDELGIPQIYASTDHDLFLTQGYIHAQDRFFEMDYRRHLTAGRLSELIGAPGLDADRVIRTLGWRYVAEQEWQLLSPDTRDYLQAYADGVNAYIESREPGQLALEYTVLGMQVEVTDVEPWDPIDSLAWLKAMAWDLLGNYSQELSRAAIYGQAEGYGEETALAMVNTIFPPYPAEQNLPIVTTPELLAAHAEAQAATVPTDPGSQGSSTTTTGSAGSAIADDWSADTFAQVAAALDAVPDALGSGDGIGSNSWAIDGRFTQTGMPLLANDPHLGPSQPGIWYQNGLYCTQTGPECDFNVAGFSFAGMPGIVIGHNAELGWGFTNMNSDASDFFLERVYPDDTYLYNGQRVPLAQRQEVIAVNGADDETIVVRSTGHGPIISDVLIGTRSAADGPLPEDRPLAGVNGFAVALQWTALTPGRTIDSIFMLNRAADSDDIAQAAAAFEVPSQNIVFATTSGDIGYQAPGLVPIRQAVNGSPVPADGSWPRPGWDPAYDWQGFVSPDDMPRTLNPEEGFIVAANQAVTEPGTEPFISRDFAYGYRSQVIRDALEQQIEAGVPFTVADMARIQMIDTDPYAQVLVPVLQEVTLPDEFTQQAVDLFEDWDMRSDADSAAAAYFAAVWTNLLRLTFWDQVPENLKPTGGTRWLAAVTTLLDEPESLWWDDRATLTVVEQRDQILVEALTAARDQLTVLLGKNPADWSWGALHVITPHHGVLGGETIPAVVRTFMNGGSAGVAGGSGIVNANGWDASQWQGGFPDFAVTWVPSMRMVLDTSDWDNSTWVQMTGNSGHSLSPNYQDQFDAWVVGENYRWASSREAIEAGAQDTLVLRPPG